MLFLMRASFELLPMGAVPRWTSQLIVTCAGVASCVSAIRMRSGSEKKRGVPEPSAGYYETQIHLGKHV